LEIERTQTHTHVRTQTNKKLNDVSIIAIIRIDR
jgi:hypothetical protein